jgi:hypothetical protein
MMSSIRTISLWMVSRSIGVMKTLWSASTQRCVMTSVSCSISLMRLAFASRLALLETIDRNSSHPLEVRRACSSKKS